MSAHSFDQVDVFGRVPGLGNPVAVVHNADDLSTEQMQSFARWMNLSETTFLSTPTDPHADYRVRIFTPAVELPFAGHPTLGSCQAWLKRLGSHQPNMDVVQQCEAGLVRIRVRGGGAAFAAPVARMDTAPAEFIAQVAHALTLPPSGVKAATWLDNGSKWLGLILDSAETVRALQPDHALLKGLCKVGVIGRNSNPTEILFEVRAFAAYVGVPEDPVTGSLNASMAQWMIGRGDAPENYVIAQGTRIGRDGRVRILKEDDALWIGGDCAVRISGTVEL